MVTRIWHGVTPASKSDEYLNLMRTVAIPDDRSTPGNKGAYALRRMEGDSCRISPSTRSDEWADLTRLGKVHRWSLLAELRFCYAKQLPTIWETIGRPCHRRVASSSIHTQFGHFDGVY